MPLVAMIAVENTAADFDKEYAYLLPQSLAGENLAGRRCTVPFGGGNQKRTGLILSVERAQERDERLKPVFALLDEAPALDGSGLFLLNYIREHTFCTYFAALGLLLPPGKAARPIKETTRAFVKLLPDADLRNLSPKQKLAAAFLAANEAATVAEVCAAAGVARAVVNALVNKGAAQLYEQSISRSPYGISGSGGEAPPALSPEQQSVLDGLVSGFDAGEAKPALLYGVTGSGKTEVFLRLIAHAAAKGKGVIVLVPEISLTAQTVRAFHKRFGARVAVLHSGLSLGERGAEWRRVKDGAADIVVGTRSAVFAPVKNLGLIVIDEEQEHSYKSDKTPRYHARDIALARCKYNRAALLLCSATPSVESYSAAKSGKYRLFTLGSRYGESLLPDVVIVDMRDKANVSAHPAFSYPLLEALHDNLSRKEQSILLLNRRGHSTLVRCAGCGASATCPNCSVAMTYHSAGDSLICHYCGHTRAMAALPICESCGSSLIRCAGLGTQKLEEELKLLFPEAGILRADTDAAAGKFSHERLFGAFAAREYDIMVGTQMVAKGLNFPGVTLVGVLGAEQSLYSGDFRSFERTFSLLTQVVGRSGRYGKRGRAFVQSYAPDNRCVLLAAEQSYPAFFDEEIKLRRFHLYPPYCALCEIGFSGDGEDEVKKAAEAFAEDFKRTAQDSYPDLPLRLLGPAPAEVLKVAGKYRYRLILKCKNTARLRELLRQLHLRFLKDRKKIQIYIDIN